MWAWFLLVTSHWPDIYTVMFVFIIIYSTTFSTQFLFNNGLHNITRITTYTSSDFNSLLYFHIYRCTRRHRTQQMLVSVIRPQHLGEDTAVDEVLPPCHQVQILCPLVCTKMAENRKMVGQAMMSCVDLSAVLLVVEHLSVTNRTCNDTRHTNTAAKKRIETGRRISDHLAVSKTIWTILNDGVKQL